MAERKPQSYSNHLRFVPLYHFVLSLLLPGPQVIIYLILWVVIPAED